MMVVLGGIFFDCAVVVSSKFAAGKISGSLLGLGRFWVSLPKIRKKVISNNNYNPPKSPSVEEYLDSVVKVSKGLCAKAIQDAVSLREIREQMDKKVLPKTPDASPAVVCFRFEHMI